MDELRSLSLPCRFDRFVRSFAKKPLRMTDRDVAQILILYGALPRLVIDTSPNKRRKIMRYSSLQNPTGIIPKSVAFCHESFYN